MMGSRVRSPAQLQTMCGNLTHEMTYVLSSPYTQSCPADIDTGIL